MSDRSKRRAKFLVWIFYAIILFFSYTRKAIQITMGVYVIRYWISIFVFENGKFSMFLKSSLL